jgi:hypothetical protein
MVKLKERITTFWGKVHTMLNSAKFPQNLQNKSWTQYENLATQLEHVVYTLEFKITPYALLHNRQLDWLDNLRTSGESAIVYNGTKAKIRTKLQDKALASIFVGYPENHAVKVCQW